VNHIKELILYQRAVQVTSGNALAARLAKSALDLSIPILTSTPAQKILLENEKVVGVQAGGEGAGQTIKARLGVVLACGGFPQDIKRIALAYPHIKMVASIFPQHQYPIQGMGCKWLRLWVLIPRSGLLILRLGCQYLRSITEAEKWEFSPFVRPLQARRDRCFEKWQAVYQ